MEDDSGEQGHERAVRAIQLVAMSGFVKDNMRLQESCLALCNSCREYIPLEFFLRICLEGPSTLLAAVWPEHLCVEADASSKILPPKRVRKVYWTFDDPGTYCRDVPTKTEEELAEVTACNVDMGKVRWPDGVREIHLSIFNRPVDEVVWPDGLELLSLCSPYHGNYRCQEPDNFDRTLDGVTFPAGLREIWLGLKFDQSIDNVTWPEGLELLSMPGFNRPIRNVRWPPGLKTLYFLGSQDVRRRQSQEPWADRWYPSSESRSFNQPLDTFLPMSLETLWLSDDFNQSLGDVTWPSGLAVLALGTRVSPMSVSLDEVEWPSSLRKLILMDTLELMADLLPDVELVFVETYLCWAPEDTEDY